jgi:CTP synthase
MWTRSPNLKAWEKIVATVKEPRDGVVTVAMVGKYVDLTESYKSLTEALNHGGFANDCHVDIAYVDSEEIEKRGAEEVLQSVTNGVRIDAVLIPGGFGIRGCEGKILAACYARKQKIPYFGICLGLQIAVIEYSRNVAKLKEATSTEFDPNAKEAVIDIMEQQKNVSKKGGSMRLGAYPCILKEETKAYAIYRQDEISERHRHRYELNNKFRESLEKAGMVFSGTSPDNKLVEIVEITDHPWFLAVQFHPEFKSTPRNPHPIFKSFIAAAKAQRNLSTKREKIR